MVSVSALMRPADIPADTPHLAPILEDAPAFFANGGSCVAGPGGEWIVAPVVGEEKLIVAELDHRRVREERHNFDPAVHYARPDVLQLRRNRTPQSTIGLLD
jgi:nitrilase